MKVTVTFLDGSQEVLSADHRQISNGCLHLARNAGLVGITYTTTEHVGSYPLTALRKWEVRED